jgi:hypothetical protein
LEILAEFKKKSGHNHPNLVAAIVNYRRLLEDMSLPTDEIDRRIQEALEQPKHLPEGRGTNDE